MNPLEYFGMEREAFSNAPDARFYFNNEQHAQALLRLMHAVDSNRGLAVLIGGVGTGKTTLARRMLDNLPEDRYESSLLVMVHAGVTADWIVTRIAMQLGVEAPASDRLTLLRQLYDRLLEIESAGRRAVVLIDEAQMLRTTELMEEFRGLLNLEIPGKKLLNIIFFGLPEVEESLNLDEPLAQRVAVKYHLRAFTPALSESYIRHRLRVAGAKQVPFTAEAMAAIHAYANGVPRLINTICDNCLFETYLRKLREVDPKIVESVAGDLGLLARPLRPAPAPAPGAEPAAAGAPAAELDEIDTLLDQLEQKA